MPIDVLPYIDPARTAVVSMECQEGLLGPIRCCRDSRSAAEAGLIETLAGLYDAARDAGVRIYYCTDERRPDEFGYGQNTLVHLRMTPGESGGGHGPVMAPITPQPSDVVFRR